MVSSIFWSGRKFGWKKSNFGLCVAKTRVRALYISKQPPTGVTWTWMNSADVLARPQFPDSLLQIARASLPSTILTIWPLVTCHATLPLIKVRRRKNLAIFCSFSVLQEYTIMATLPVIGVRRKNLDMFAFAGIHLFPFPPSLSSSSPLYQVKNVWFRKNQSKESIFLKRAFMCCYSFWQVKH